VASGTRCSAAAFTLVQAAEMPAGAVDPVAGPQSRPPDAGRPFGRGGSNAEAWIPTPVSKADRADGLVHPLTEWLVPFE